jgi:K+-transporting ATPase, c chain
VADYIRLHPFLALERECALNSPRRTPRQIRVLGQRFAFCPIFRALIFSALIIIALIPLSMRGRHLSSGRAPRRSCAAIRLRTKCGALVGDMTQDRLLGVFGERRVNVLKLNMSLDQPS